VAGLAFYAWLCPGSNQTRLIILIPSRAVTGSVALATIVLKLRLARVIAHPAVVLKEDRVGEIILVQICGIGDHLARRVGDNIAVLVDEPGFPVVSADDIADIVPGIAFRRSFEPCEWVFRRLAIHHRVELPGMARFYVNIIDIRVATAAGLCADVLCASFSDLFRLSGRALFSGRPLGTFRTGRPRRAGFASRALWSGTGYQQDSCQDDDPQNN
jgi:hypothetical protein